MLTKRGQGGAGAAVLLAIIASIIVLFIIVLPPGERAELLDDKTTSNQGTTSTSGNLLLQVNPGRIDYLAQREIEHPLPVVSISTQDQSVILAERNVASAKKGVFTDEVTEIRFNLNDLDHTKTVVFGFSVTQETPLRLLLNDEIIFEGIQIGGNTIPLPKDLLTESNKIVIATPSPGIAFWKTNGAQLQNVKVIAEIINTEAQIARQIILVGETEKQNLDHVQLRFQPECRAGEVGSLLVKINNKIIYDAVPDCDVRMVPIDFSSDLLTLGENELTFRTERGRYVLVNVIITSNLKDVDFPTYYFELSQEQFTRLKTDRLRLRMDFVDVTTAKRGEIIFNGHVQHFDTKEPYLTFDLEEDGVRGTNSLKIKPKKTIEVRELSVELLE